MTKYVVTTRQPLLVEDVDKWTSERGVTQLIVAGEPIKSAVFVPLFVGARLRGLISIQNVDRTGAFNESDLRLLTTLAGSLSVALENARLVDETRQRAAELATINQIGQATASLLDLDELIALAGDEMARTFKADIAYVALYDPQTRLIEFPYHVENGVRETQDPIPLGEGLTSRIIQSRQPLLLNQAADFEEIRRHGIGTAPRSYLGVPIMVGDDAIGAIRELREQPGGGLQVWGSSSLATQLIANDLVDEYCLFVEPILLGGGKTIFPADGRARPLELVSLRQAKTGVLICAYRPARRAA
jgi:GAF domain-containing protein